MNWNLLATVAAPIIGAFVGAYLTRAFENRPRLISYLGHVSAFRLPGHSGGPPVDVFTHSIIVRNAGRRAATNVRIGHNFLPNFQLHPAVAHQVVATTAVSQGSPQEILFPSLVPGEQVTISYLYFPPVTWDRINAYAKSDEGLARILQVLPTPQLPAWQQRGVRGLLALGVIAAAYLIGIAIRALIPLATSAAATQ